METQAKQGSPLPDESPERRGVEQRGETDRLAGAILAAGRGSRMAVFSERSPKPLLPVCNRPLIEHQIEIMKALGIREITVLIGHKGFEIAKTLGDGSALGVSIRYVEQEKTLGIAHAVGQLEPHLNRPFMLFLGDIFFVPGNLRAMVEAFAGQGGGAVLATKEEKDPAAIRRNYALTISDDGFVTRVVEKPRHTTNHHKGVGLYLFDLTIFDAIRRTPRSAMRDEYELTDSIQIMIDDGHPVRPVNAVVDDVNLTTPVDLLAVNLAQVGLTPAGQIVGSGSRLHPEARVEASVIGSDVTVEHPIHISHSVIFDNTTVDFASSLDHCLVTPEWCVDCKSGRAVAEPRL
jgi:dTDP-glucose pyrophosphorylase